MYPGNLVSRYLGRTAEIPQDRTASRFLRRSATKSLSRTVSRFPGNLVTRFPDRAAEVCPGRTAPVYLCRSKSPGKSVLEEVISPVTCSLFEQNILTWLYK